MGFSHFTAATLLLLLLPLATSDEGTITCFCEEDFAGNFPNQASNFKEVVSDLVRRTSASRFANFSMGTAGADAVNGLAWCRSDMDAATCGVCVSEADQSLLKFCPHSVATRIWHGNLCFLRLGPGDFFGKPDISYVRVLVGSEMVPEEYRMPFIEKMTALMDSLRQNTPLRPMKFEKEDAMFVEDNKVINGMALCSPDLDPEGCGQCLSVAISKYPYLCTGHYNCELIYGSCVVQYDARKTN